jgi:hypothetical protein
MQSLPTNTQAYLITSFLRDCRFAKGIASSAITASDQLPMASPALPHTPAHEYEQAEDDQHLPTFNLPTPTRSTKKDSALLEEPTIDPTLDQATLAMLTTGDTKSCE